MEASLMSRSSESRSESRRTSCSTWQVFVFLSEHEPRGTTHAAEWAGVNGLLALLFAVSHSLLLHPAVRGLMMRWVPAPFYGLCFCSATSGSLLAVIAGWRDSALLVWRFEGPLRPVIQGLFGAS